MARSVADLVDDITSSVGRTDSQADSWALLGINVANFVVTQLHQPPEARTNGTVTASNAQYYVDYTTTLSRLLVIDRIYNETASQPMYSLPFDLLDALVARSEGNARYYALHGEILHYRPKPASGSPETLRVYYLQSPAWITSDGAIPYEGFDHVYLTVGSEILAGMMEEVETSNMWINIAQQVGLPSQAISQLRSLVRREMPYVDISESSA